MAAKVKILNVEKIVNKIKSVYGQDLRSSVVFELIKDFTIERVRAQTRIGNDLTKSRNIQSATKQPELSKAYVGFRKRLLAGKVKDTHPWWFDPDKTFAKAEKSNLTATGQLLDSLDGRVTRTTMEVQVFPTGSRDQSKQSSKTFSTNVALAKDLASRGRTFLGLDKLGIQRIRKLILDELRRLRKARGL